MVSTIRIKRKDYQWLCEEVKMDGDEEFLDTLNWMHNNLDSSESEEVLSFYCSDSEAFGEFVIDLFDHYDIPYRGLFTDSEYNEDHEEAYHTSVGYVSVNLTKDGNYSYQTIPTKQFIEPGEDPFIQFKEVMPELFQ